MRVVVFGFGGMHCFQRFYSVSRISRLCFPVFMGWSTKRQMSSKMVPIPDDTSSWVKKTINSSAVLLFSKSRCPYCRAVKQIFNDDKINHAVIELDKRPDGAKIQQVLSQISGISTVPQVFVRGEFVGDSSTISKLKKEDKLTEVIKKNTYDYDLVVIGGGSGGLAASKEAARFGAKTAVFDFVVPTPQDTTWGLGGTCVNVGCIPKKLMHQAALLREGMSDSVHFGWKWDSEKIEHDWAQIVENIGNHIHSLNWGYRTQLRSINVEYVNAFAEVVDPHTIKYTKKNKETGTVTAKVIILATGERPRYPGIPGDKEYAITSDDLFWLPYPPGKTLVVGASYVALECAGFLTRFGFDTTVMVRSIFLRGFDQQMADMIGEYMKEHGTKFVRSCVPTAIVMAIGRDPTWDRKAMESVGLKLDKAKRVVCADNEQSSVDSIYAIGDIVSGKPQLTPVAIHAGRYLARRLYAGDIELTDYVNVPTTIFTPIEYGACGLSEEDAITKYGKENIEVSMFSHSQTFWTVRIHFVNEEVCYLRYICLFTV
ncbi:putative pyridine nucleotide-disulfide oxidoreductase [Fasciola gigantica]|uniref:thioredoxin-disulfide reductase (NADPH) n=1 Tax=Fasciola gigantica TaxID=46835 RepID=A0A504YZM6_FASGI|nr:putative pyridine nucleotide-disulfide oxidoreductase [Fasciola gigantica]